jgi:hypothetical protein
MRKKGFVPTRFSEGMTKGEPTAGASERGRLHNHYNIIIATRPQLRPRFRGTGAIHEFIEREQTRSDREFYRSSQKHGGK